ncbi:hypothetical protein RB595_002446 [Gaeumannomyces hyphopodioides]
MASPQPAPRPPPALPSKPCPPSSSSSTTSPPATGYSLLSGRIPAPLQRLFDRFPLTTYPPNDLPARCPLPAERDLPTLHVFISEEDAARGRPSFNPTCLKWQTFLKIAGVDLRLVPSTNHASPSGALPFLLPPIVAADAPAPKSPPPTSPNPAPVPAHKLQAYARAHGTTTTTTTPPSSQQQNARGAGAAAEPAYAALLDHAVRRAWLHALYVSPANAPLAARLYLALASRHPLVRSTLRAQLRAAAAAELASARNGVDPPPAAELYAEARAALAALAQLLPPPPETETETEGGSPSGWFFGAAAPGMFDAAVFAYTHLLLPGSGLEWVDRRLPEAVEAFPALVAHRARMLARLWDEDGAAGDWEKV